MRGRLVILLVHLRVLSVRGLGVTAVVTIGTVVRITVWGGILSHAFRKSRTLRAVLRGGVVARHSRLVPDGWKLSVRRRLTRYADSLSHLTVHGRFAGRATVMRTLLHIGAVALLVSFALLILLLLFRLPLFAYLFEFYGREVSSYSISNNVCQDERDGAQQWLAAEAICCSGHTMKMVLHQHDLQC